MAEFDPVALLRTLEEHRVRFVVIGGVAAVLHGAPTVTLDVDITPDRAGDNLEQLAEALRDLEARLRTTDDPLGVPFPIEPGFLSTVDSWTLTTRHGDLDLVFRPDGTDGFADLVRGAGRVRVAEDPPLTVSVAALLDVIRSKEAAGRDKDRAVLPLLRRTLEESGGHTGA